MKTLLNDGWEYVKLPLNSSYKEACSSAGWTAVDLPHDWLIWQHTNLYESADAWYRRTLIRETETGSCILSFDGVYMDCDVLLNGEVLYSHAYGYTAFFVDLTEHIRRGANEVAVHIRHQSPNSRWYSGSGIFRDVYLLDLPEDHIVPDSFIITEKQESGVWKIDISAETAGMDRIPFFCSAVYPNGDTLAVCDTQSRNGRISLTMPLPGAEAWDTDNPVLYTLRYRYGSEAGERKFGVRSIEFLPDCGFRLNGRPMKLKGVCLHHDLGALGAAFHEKAARRQLLLMKNMGANALRTSHNPPASKLLDLCDEMGILVVDEAFDMWERPKTQYDYARFFTADEAKDVSLWIRRDRCHPCVIMWSIGNEIYDMHADMRGTEICRMLRNQVRENDPYGHAAVTFGCNYMPWEGGQRCADIIKIAGYNYGEKYYDEHHRKHPDWVIYGSETASVLSSRGIYHFPIEKSIMSEADLQCSALGNSNTSWGAQDLYSMITDDLKCPYSMGQFIWSGIDYIGEPTPYHTRSCYFGQADTACFPKDSYYLFQSMWSDEPVLHIGVSWDWNPGQMIDVPVMTNAPKTELLLNGESLGIRDVRQDDACKCLQVWKVPFVQGELLARALDTEGRIIQETSRKTSGDTAGFLLSAEDESLKGDGHDLVFITIQAVDSCGNHVDNARDRVTIRVSGGAYLVGTDNGDSTDCDGYKQNCRRLFGGKLLVIAASNGTAEDLLLTADSTGGIHAEIRIPVLPADPVDGRSCLQRIPEAEAAHEIPIRKIEICAEGCRELTKEHPECLFRWRLLPEDAQQRNVTWQVTNEAGIETPFAAAEPCGRSVKVIAKGDGRFFLRALGGNADDHPEIISQIGFSASGIGNPGLNPYQFISAGLYDIYEGDIGTGNEKGIAFARDGESMVGFSSVDFGKDGSDTLFLPVFALNGDPYEIELLDGDPRQGGKLITVLHYCKPSIWNRYQEETYRLPVRLTGVHNLCFRMREKVHLKGFRFEKQKRISFLLSAGEADAVYGDTFERSGTGIFRIGNNVSLRFEGMDFGEISECLLMIRGRTDLEVNAVTIRILGENGKSSDEVANFRGDGGTEQTFRVHVPGGICSVTFVFLPGSSFDFESFRFLL